MTTYFITWLAVFTLAATARRHDYLYDDELSYGRIKHTAQSNMFSSLACMILIFVAGCMYYIGSDYYAYYGWYQSYAESLSERIRTLNEPAISIIYSIVVKFYNDGFACIFALGAIMIWLVIRTLRNNTTDICLAIILYAITCWVATFNGMRQALAVSVVFAGFPYLRDKKLLQYAMCIFAAYLCHKSAIIFILLFFVVHRKVDLGNLTLLIITTIVVLFSYDRVFAVTDIILDKEINPNAAYNARAVNMLRVAANCAPGIVFGVIWWNRPRSEKHDFYLNLLFINAIISLMTSNSAYLARLNMFSKPFQVIAICELLKVNLSSRRIVKIGIVLLFLLFETYEVYHSADLSPFRWIWSRGGSYYGW